MQKRIIDAKIKLAIISEYERGVIGYKLLAKKYSLSRDTVRSIILSSNEKQNCYNNISMKITKEDLEKTEKDNKLETQEDYKAAFIYWKTYAKLIEKEIDLNVKKTPIQISRSSF